MAFNIIAKRSISDAQALPPIPTMTASAGIVQASGTGAVLHLDARVGVTSDINGRVSSWADQSPTGNNFGQVVATKQPLLMTDNFGNQGIKFDHSARADLLIGSASDHRDKTIVIVLKEQYVPQDPSLNRYLWISYKADSGLLLYDRVYGSGTMSPSVILGDRVVNAVKVLSNSDNTSNHAYYTKYTSTLMSTNNTIQIVKQRRGMTYSAAASNGAGVAPIGLDALGVDIVPRAYYGNFIVYEVAVFDKILTNLESTNIDTYIANTYGAV